MPVAGCQSTLAVVELGRVGYAEATALQAKLVGRRQAGEIGDVLLLLEHPPVITLGRNAKPEHVLRSPEALAAEGVELAECDRGGDVTFHGPGQIVGYPIFDLRACPRPACLPPRTGRLELGPVDFVRALEEVLIRTAASCGVPAQRIPGLTGVWTTTEPARKFAAIGIHVARGVTSHGFALNVNPDLAAFDAIVPCGLHGRQVTSLAREAATPWDPAAVLPRLRREFLDVFHRQLAEMPLLWDDELLHQTQP